MSMKQFFWGWLFLLDRNIAKPCIFHLQKQGEHNADACEWNVRRSIRWLISFARFLRFREALDNKLHGLTKETGGSDRRIKKHLTEGDLKVFHSIAAVQWLQGLGLKNLQHH